MDMSPAPNSPMLWELPDLRRDGSKYDRGHCIVLGGPAAHTGAARLAARAALRIGAGLVSVACDPGSLIVYATALQAVMIRVVKDADAFADLIEDRRITSLVLGPAAGVSDRTRDIVLAALAAERPCVLDADALSVFKGMPLTLFDAIRGPVLMTPHEGEFARLFPCTGYREDDALRAARMCGAVVLLKGPDTVIAAPDGRLVVNHDAPPTLATAGSGDVLAGFAGGLMAQGLPAFESACAAAWIHAEAARRFGPGLIAEDLSEQVPGILAALRTR